MKNFINSESCLLIELCRHFPILQFFFTVKLCTFIALNSLKPNFLLSDGSRSGTPVMGKPPKQSRDSIGDAANIIPKTTTATVPTTSYTHTRTTSATSPPLPIHHTEEKSTDKPEIVQPSEFLPKFAAVLDKSTPPVLNSVAALEAKRAYDRQTRLRSMLAVIAGEGMWLFLLCCSLTVLLLFLQIVFGILL
jgi:hypothetical protein